MSTINNGGPAFPVPDGPGDPWEKGHRFESEGMSMRDYFAAKAMREMNWNDFDGSARECYEIADAMLRAREAS